MMRNVSLILITILINLSLSQYQTSWIVSLRHQPSSLKVALTSKHNNKHIIVGFANGHIQIIDPQSRQIVKQHKLFDEPITYIQVDTENSIIFAVSLTNIAQLDHQYNTVKILKYKKRIKQISLSKYQQTSYINLQTGTKLLSFAYLSPSSNSSFEETIIWNHQQQQNIFEMSFNHQFIYTVSRDQHQLKIHKVPLFSPDSSQSSNLDAYSLQKSTIMTRKYSFKIANLMIDRKQTFSNKDEDLIMINEEQTIYYMKSGNIVTYIPYSSQNNQHLISFDYCENIFMAILHERVIRNEYQYYLTLIRKDTLFAHKVIFLNMHYDSKFRIVRMDCNHNLIVIQTDQMSLIVLQSYRVFHLRQYLQQILIASSILALLFLYCRGKKKQAFIMEKTTIKEQQQTLEKGQHLSSKLLTSRQAQRKKDKRK